MPGYIMHLAMAERILELAGIRQEPYRNFFCLGNIAPDLKVGNGKKITHFWDDETYKKFVRRPGLSLFLSEYGERMKEPFIFGYYCHLYLDAAFLDEYWAKHFIFYDSEGKPAEGYDEVAKVYLRDSGMTYERGDFFSEENFYGDYTRLSGYFVKKYIGALPVYEKTDGIRELDIEEEKERLLHMLDFIEKLKKDEKKSEAPRVLSLDDMEKLIENTAKKLSEIWAKIVEQKN